MPPISAAAKPPRDYRLDFFRGRHDIMKHWVATGIVKFDDSSRAMQRLNADQVHGCLGLLLADIVDRAARRASGGTGTASPR
jgi:hypothetical protein